MFLSPLDCKVHKVRDCVCLCERVYLCFLIIAALAPNPVIIIIFS